MVFLNALNNGEWVNLYMEGTASSLANLDAVNGAVDISATSRDFIDSVDSKGNIIGKIGMFIFCQRTINCSYSIMDKHKFQRTFRVTNIEANI